MYRLRRHVAKSLGNCRQVATAPLGGAHAGGPHMNFEELQPDPITGKMTVVNNMHIYLMQ